MNNQIKLPVLGNIPKHWKVKKLGSLLKEKSRNGIYKSSEFHGKGDKIVNMGEMFAFDRLFSVPMKRIQITDDERRRFHLNEGDLLFC